MISVETAAAERFIIVRAGAVDVYERLRRKCGGKPRTRILYDRRAAPTAPGPHAQVERRFPQVPAILASRGFFAIRAARRRRDA
jgi:hypothetical protein